MLEWISDKGRGSSGATAESAQDVVWRFFWQDPDFCKHTELSQDREDEESRGARPTPDAGYRREGGRGVPDDIVAPEAVKTVLGSDYLKGLNEYDLVGLAHHRLDNVCVRLAVAASYKPLGVKFRYLAIRY